MGASTLCGHTRAELIGYVTRPESFTNGARTVATAQGGDDLWIVNQQHDGWDERSAIATASPADGRRYWLGPTVVARVSFEHAADACGAA